MKKQLVLALSACALILTAGCGTPGTHTHEQSVIGTLVGAGAGTLIGAAWGRPAEGALAGALLGAAAGTAVGSSMDQDEAAQARAQAQAQAQAHTQANPPVSKHDLLSMTKAGVGADVIVTRITAASYVYPLSTQDIIELKNEGVADSALNAMIEKARVQTSNPPAATQRTSTTTVVVEPVPVPYLHFWYDGHWRPGPPPPHHHRPPPPPGPRPGPRPGHHPGPRPPGPPR